VAPASDGAANRPCGAAPGRCRGGAGGTRVRVYYVCLIRLFIRSGVSGVFFVSSNLRAINAAKLNKSNPATTLNHLK